MRRVITPAWEGENESLEDREFLDGFGKIFFATEWLFTPESESLLSLSIERLRQTRVSASVSSGRPPPPPCIKSPLSPAQLYVPPPPVATARAATDAAHQLPPSAPSPPRPSPQRAPPWSRPRRLRPRWLRRALWAVSFEVRDAL